MVPIMLFKKKKSKSIINMVNTLTFDQKFNLMESADLSLAGWTRNMVIIVTAGVAIQQFHKNNSF